MAVRPQSPDFIIFFTVIALLGLGVVMVYSSSAVSAYVNFDDSYYFLKRQIVWVALGIAGDAVYDEHRLSRLAPTGQASHAGYLAAAHPGSCARPGQSGERSPAVAGVRLALSAAVGDRQTEHGAVFGREPDKESGQDREFTRGLLPQLLMLLLVFGLILKEPDLGTALAISGTVFVLLFTAGAKISHLTSLGVTGVTGIIAAIIVEPYRLRRLLAFSDPWSDPLDTGYHIIQSLYAIGSGGLFGVGLGRSREKFLYLPEPHTDFIFAILGKNWGSSAQRR